MSKLLQRKDVDSVWRSGKKACHGNVNMCQGTGLEYQGTNGADFIAAEHYQQRLHDSAQLIRGKCFGCS